MIFLYKIEFRRFFWILNVITCLLSVGCAGLEDSEVKNTRSNSNQADAKAEKFNSAEASPSESTESAESIAPQSEKAVENSDESPELDSRTPEAAASQDEASPPKPLSEPEELTAPDNLTYDLHSKSNSESPNISWDKVVEAVNYEIAIGSDPGGDDVSKYALVGDVSTYKITELSLENGKNYYVTIRGIGSAGEKGAAAEGDGWQNLWCPSGYVKVSGNEEPGLGGARYTKGTKTRYDGSQRAISDFCVMKYEAKILGDDTGSTEYSGNMQVESRSGGQPWGHITRSQAITECEETGGASLINNSQWQAVAREIESRDENWKDNTALGGIGNMLSRGNSNNTMLLPASENDSDGCVGLFQNTFNSLTITASCGSVWHVNRRTHGLNSGEVIWDIIGNTWEWLRDDTVKYSGAEMFIRDAIQNPVLKKIFGPFGDHAGKTGPNAGALGTFSPGEAGGMFRGSGWGKDTAAGIFSTYLTPNLNTSEVNLGFRCVYAP